MLLSFSVDSMRPMIKAGLRQRAGEDVGSERVKRQTIRHRGPRAEKLLAHAKDAGWTIPYDLHLWWKSRTKDREFLGCVSHDDRPFQFIRCWWIEILHSSVEPPGGEPYQCIRVCAPRGVIHPHDGMAFWSPGQGAGCTIEQFARADGFETVEAFRDFFVPNDGDRFQAILFRW